MSRVANAPRIPRAAVVSSATLSARSVTMRYGSRAALQDVSFELKAGELAAIIGPNGAGKTTLLSIMAGVLTPSEGEIVGSPREIGWVPQLLEKVALSAGCAAAVTLAMSAFISVFVHLDWTRVPLWVLTLAFGGLAFGALGVTIGGLAREVSVGSLLALLVSLPIAFVALVPPNAVSGGLRTVLDAVAFVFPFKSALQAVSNAFSAVGPGIGWPLVHLAVLTLVFGALGRLALRRFA